MNELSQIPPVFNAVKDDNETIFWVGKPVLVPFLMQGIIFLAFGLIWGLIDFGFLGLIFSSEAPAGLAFFIIPFFMLHSFPFWGSILNMIRLWLVHGNTYYAYTNKRLMMRSGFWGIDFKAIDYDKISDIEVNINPVESYFGVGTVRAYSGRDTAKGGRIYDSFVAIENPYEVFKKIKEISVDIKTDWNYPNALRPEENPGYKTSYNPDEKERNQP
jgi:hypothetical protein